MTNDEKKTETATAEATETVAPKKMLLSKRVVRHFNVRSGVQAGLWNDGTVCQTCIKIRCAG